jgi:hypothetical protein
MKRKVELLYFRSFLMLGMHERHWRKGLLRLGKGCWLLAWRIEEENQAETVRMCRLFGSLNCKTL